MNGAVWLAGELMLDAYLFADLDADNASVLFLANLR